MTHALIAPIPPGAIDLTGAAVQRRRSLQRTAMAQLEAAHYAEVSPPTFEYETVFVRAGGPAVAEQLLRFLDLDGRTLALRYDFTASVARVAATTFADAAPPLRFCYSGKVYRQEPERGARPREILQVGAELMGSPGLSADVEIIRLTIALLREFGVADFQLNIGHVGVLAAGLAVLDEPRRANVRRWIDRKDRASLVRELGGAGGAAETLTSLPFVMGRRETLESALTGAPDAARGGLEHLLDLEGSLTGGERDHVVFDLGEVRGLDYYTGIHFEVFVAGCGRAVGTGGRYDDLMGRFGRDLPAVGVSLDLDALAERAR